MKVGMDGSSRLTRLSLFILLGIFLSRYLPIFRHGVKLLENWYLILLPLLFIYAITLFLFRSAPAELTEEGVYVRWFLCKHFYPWQSIRQALVLKSRYRNMEQDLVLVPRYGSPRKAGERDTLFHLRNHFRLIYLPASAELIGYVRSVYGSPICDRQTRNEETI